jgi:hypothetical protein
VSRAEERRRPGREINMNEESRESGSPHDISGGQTKLVCHEKGDLNGTSDTD